MPAFRVLFVCTGNICRSPMAEQLLRTRLAEQIPRAAGRFAISSAGTMDLAGAAMHPQAQQTLLEMGIDVPDHRARGLTAELVGQADLVLGLTRQHRAAAVLAAPAALRRTFTLLEFERLCAGMDRAALASRSPTKRAASVVEAAAARRGLCPPESPADDDVADPIGQSAASYTATAQLIDRPIRRFVELLSVPGSGPNDQRPRRAAG